MYFAKIFRTPFSKHPYFSTLPDVFFRNSVSKNIRSRWFNKCFELSSKNSVKSCAALSNICICVNVIFLQDQVVSRDIHVPCVCVYVRFVGYFFKDRPSGVIIVCSSLNIFFIFYWKEGIENPPKRTESLAMKN